MGPDEAKLDDVVVREPYQTDPEKDEGPREEFGVKKNDLGEDVVKQEFQDHEILAAFKFIDLDHNNFIGAKEIRHILVCMGEMITDEEIDCMISMVDMDGDGQVSYTEFRTLVLHPDPGTVDMHKVVNKRRTTSSTKSGRLRRAKARSPIYLLTSARGSSLHVKQRRRPLWSLSRRTTAHSTSSSRHTRTLWICQERSVRTAVSSFSCSASVLEWSL